MHLYILYFSNLLHNKLLQNKCMKGYTLYTIKRLLKCTALHNICVHWNTPDQPAWKTHCSVLWAHWLYRGTYSSSYNKLFQFSLIFDAAGPFKDVFCLCSQFIMANDLEALPLESESVWNSILRRFLTVLSLLQSSFRLLLDGSGASSFGQCKLTDTGQWSLSCGISRLHLCTCTLLTSVLLHIFSPTAIILYK